MKKLYKLASGLAAISMTISLLGVPVFAADPGPTSPDNSKQPLNFWASGYEAKWISQTGSMTLPADEYYDVNPGDKVTVTAKFENTGSKTWIPDSADRQVCIAIYKDPNVTSAPASYGYDDPTNPNFGKSYFKDSSWESDYRIGCINQDEVDPGEQGTFTLPFKIPTGAPSGRLREDISLASGPYWMANPTNGDPLGVAHIWVGFDIEGTQSGEQASINIYPFDTSLIPGQTTAMVVSVEDQDGDPVEGYTSANLLVEIFDGMGDLENVDNGNTVNIEEVDQDGLPGIYEVRYTAGDEPGDVTLRITNMSVIPQAQTSLTLNITDQNMSVEVLPDVLTAGGNLFDYDGDGTNHVDMALLAVKLLDTNGDPVPGQAAELRAEVTKGDITVCPYAADSDTACVADNTPFAEVATDRGIYMARVAAGFVAGEAKIRVTNNNTGAVQEVSLEQKNPEIEVSTFPKDIYSRRTNDVGFSTVLIVVKDAQGRIINVDLSDAGEDALEVEALKSVAGADLLCDVGGGDSPIRTDIGAALAPVGVYSCQYIAPDTVLYNTDVPIRVKYVPNNTTAVEDISLHVGNREFTGIATQMETRLINDVQNKDITDNNAILAFMADARGNAVGNDGVVVPGSPEIPGDLEDPGTEWDPFVEIVENYGGIGNWWTGIFYSNLSAGFNDEDTEEIDVKYEDNVNDIDLEETLSLEVKDFAVIASAFPSSIAAFETTAIMVVVLDAFGGPARNSYDWFDVTGFDDACANDQDIIFDPKNGVINDVIVPNEAWDYGLFAAEFESDDNDDGEVEIDLCGDRSLEDEAALEIPVGANDQLELTAFPSNIVIGARSTIIMMLRTENGSPISIAEADRNDTLDLDSEDDDYSFDDWADADNDTLNYIVKLGDSGGVETVEEYSGSGGAFPVTAVEDGDWDAGDGLGIYLIPYRAPVENGAFSDTVTVEYDGGTDKISESVTINVED